MFVISESSLLCPFFCFSPVHPEDDNGEYLLEYIPKINPITITTGPAYLITTSPYSTTPQNPATNKKLSHGSPLVQVNNPTNLFSGSRNGCEYANARVIWGGVCINSGDFWWTRIVERCLFAEVECDSVTGENDANVGGFGSLDGDEASSLDRLEVDIKSSQGVSCYSCQ